MYPSLAMLVTTIMSYALKVVCTRSTQDALHGERNLNVMTTLYAERKATWEFNRLEGSYRYSREACVRVVPIFSYAGRMTPDKETVT